MVAVVVGEVCLGKAPWGPAQLQEWARSVGRTERKLEAVVTVGSQR